MSVCLFPSIEFMNILSLLLVVEGDRVYMKIKVDPLNPASLTTTFYGPTKQVEQYRRIYYEKLDDWNMNEDIYRNLLRIFGRKKMST